MTELDMNCRYRQNPDLITADMDGEKVMMSLVHGKYFGVNSVGSRIWELLEATIAFDGICHQIMEEFAVEEAQCRADLLAFMTELLNQDMICQG